MIDMVLVMRNLVFAIFMSISIGMLLVAGGIVAYKKYRQKSYVQTTGTVVDFSQRMSKSGGLLFAPIVEIKVKGKVFRATSRVASSWTSYAQGDRLMVRFDPKNPNRMVFGSSFHQYLVPFIFAIQGVIWFFVSWLVFFLMSDFGRAGSVQLFLSGIFGFVAAGFWVTTAVLVGRKWYTQKDFVLTTGTVVDQLNRPGNTGDFLYSPVVEIKVNNRRYQGRSNVATSWAQYVVGDKVRVWYDPTNPKHMAFGGFFSRNSLSVFFAGFAVVFTVVAIILFF